MPRRAQHSTELASTRGQYHRTLGRWINSKGNLEPRKWWLGSDRKRAQLASQLLENLWSQVEAEHARQQQAGVWPFKQSVDQVVAQMQVQVLQQEQIKPRWTREVLPLAEAARVGRTYAYIPQADGESPQQYATRIARLRKLYPAVAALAEDEQAFTEGRAHANQAAAAFAGLTRTLSEAGGVEHLCLLGESLYEAIHAYADHVTSQSKSEHAQVEQRYALRLKDSIEDMDLAEFDRSAIEKITAYWKRRPPSNTRAARKRGKPMPIAVATVERQLKTFRRLLRWLDESHQWAWEAPKGWERATRVDLRRMETSAELAKRAQGPETFTVEQLTDMWANATDFERLLILLGLNAACGPAEMMGLRWDEVQDEGIRRIRNKSRVLGQIKLWPETIRARLRDRMDTPVWWLSMKHLRKTGAQLIWEVSDGETMAMYLSHGKVVQSDPLADYYSKRPFDRVNDALDAVHEKLKPMFEAVADAFTSERIGDRGPARSKR